MCVGGALVDYECDHTLPWYMCGGQRSWFFPSTMYVPWNQTQVVKLGSKHLYLLLSYLTSPQCALRHCYSSQVLPGTPRLNNIHSPLSGWDVVLLELELTLVSHEEVPRIRHVP